MPANLPPDARKKWAEVEETKNPRQRIQRMEEFLSLVPKHKGTAKTCAQVQKQCGRAIKPSSPSCCHPRLSRFSKQHPFSVRTRLLGLRYLYLYAQIKNSNSRKDLRFEKGNCRITIETLKNTFRFSKNERLSSDGPVAQ